MLCGGLKRTISMVDNMIGCETLKVFQLRAARSTLGLGVRDIGAYIDLSRSTISKIERMDINVDLNITQEQNRILIRIFNDKGVFFPDENTVLYKDLDHNNKQLLTRFQLRGSRAILGLTQRELAEILYIEKKVLTYLEGLPNSAYIATTNTDLIHSKFKNFFDGNSITFPNNGIISLKH